MTRIGPDEFGAIAPITATLVPYVLCAATDTGLWPVSRRDFGKQHSAILGEVSPFQATLARLAAFSRQVRPCVITSAESRFMVADQARAVGVEIDLVVEPEPRKTLAAVTLAALLVARHGPDAIALVVPSDHHVTDTDAFVRTAERAALAARGGDLVVLGRDPEAAATGYGYIVPGEEVGPGLRRVARFADRPEAGVASGLVEGGAAWNTGIVCFSGEAGLREIARCAPAVLAPVQAALDSAVEDLGALAVGPEFSGAPRASFDAAVLERTERAVVLDCDFDWSDIGDWRKVWERSDKDADGNAIMGDGVVRDGRNTYIRAETRLVCALGVEDLAIVDTPDALLVAPLARAQEVPGMVAALAAGGRPEAVSSARVYRPWGWYQSMDLGHRFRVKRIHVFPGKKLSLQRHHHRAEHWVVVCGTAEVTRDHETLIVRENESIYLPLGCVHRLANVGRIPVEIVEVQTGTYLEEDDIVRIEDDFGRVGKPV